MAETTQFTIGADVSCTDGVCGEVSRVVIDPVARAVTHLVVEPKHRQGLGRLVPLDLVDATTGEVRLGCTVAEFDKLGAAEETQFVPGSRYAAYSPGQVLSWPYYSLMGNASQTTTLRHRPLGRGGRAPRRPSPCDRRRHRASPGDRHRPSQSPRDPCAPPRRALVGQQGCGYPDPRCDWGRRRYRAQHHQTAGAGLASRGHRSPHRVDPPGCGEGPRQWVRITHAVVVEQVRGDHDGC